MAITSLEQVLTYSDKDIHCAEGGLGLVDQLLHEAQERGAKAQPMWAEHSRYQAPQHDANPAQFYTRPENREAVFARSRECVGESAPTFNEFGTQEPQDDPSTA